MAEQSQCRVLAFIHIAAHGLAASGCSGGGEMLYEGVGKLLLVMGGQGEGLSCVIREKCSVD